jgi:two-component system CheB/CheR fusion protein
MPLHATQAILVDIVAPVEELPAKLIALLNTVVENESSIDSKTELVSLSSYFEKRQVMIFYYIKKTTLIASKGVRNPSIR